MTKVQDMENEKPGSLSKWLNLGVLSFLIIWCSEKEKAACLQDNAGNYYKWVRVRLAFILQQSAHSTSLSR